MRFLFVDLIIYWWNEAWKKWICRSIWIWKLMWSDRGKHKGIASQTNWTQIHTRKYRLFSMLCGCSREDLIGSGEGLLPQIYFFNKKNIYKKHEGNTRQKLRNIQEIKKIWISNNYLKKLPLQENFSSSWKEHRNNPLHALENLNIPFLAS